MKTRSIAALLVLPLLVSLSGCGKTHESLAEDQMKVMEDVVATLKTVKDEATAKAAAEKLKTLKAKGDELEKQMKELGEPPAELKTKYDEKAKKVAGELVGEMIRIQGIPDAAKHLNEVFKK